MTESISVAMATYNGEAYIEQQLKSILPQLGVHDEIILVDDHSVDSTLDIVGQINDARIKVHRNEANMGVRRSFEKAIGLTGGQIIFLSDQDDVWHPEKVARFAEAFGRSPQVTLVLSDAAVVDKHGNVLVSSFFGQRGAFVPGVVANLIKNKYLGCVMAFRRSLVTRILPFPASIPQHDMWIGLVNGIYGEACYLGAPLVEYRRHDSNASQASSNKRASLGKMIVWRWALVTSLVARVISQARLAKS